MVAPILVFFLCSLLGWFKGNANKLGLCDFTLIEWTLYTSVPSSFAMLWAFWQILEEEGVWTANLVSASIGLTVTLCMNSFLYGVDIKKTVALVLILLISIIVR